jgi:CO/xanthine dehydrogenase Mo-binding subunit
MPSKYMVNASVGNVGIALSTAKDVIQASHTTPIESHASLGPSCAIADVRGDTATVWAGTQDPALLRGNVAQYLGISQENVRIVWFEGSGCYGRNGADVAALDAVIMSKLAGKPVRVQWMRWDEHGWDPKGPATVHDLVGAVDAKGNLMAWGRINSGPRPVADAQAGQPVAPSSTCLELQGVRQVVGGKHHLHNRTCRYPAGATLTAQS